VKVLPCNLPKSQHRETRERNNCLLRSTDSGEIPPFAAAVMDIIVVKVTKYQVLTTYWTQNREIDRGKSESAKSENVVSIPPFARRAFFPASPRPPSLPSSSFSDWFGVCVWCWCLVPVPGAWGTPSGNILFLGDKHPDRIITKRWLR